MENSSKPDHPAAPSDSKQRVSSISEALVIVHEKDMGNKEKEKERREKRMQEMSILRTIPYTDYQRLWYKETVAVVTGGNRGIGFEICRQLAGYGLTVILTSRDASAGCEAAKVLQEGGLSVLSHQLDVLDSSSIHHFAEWLQKNYAVDVYTRLMAGKLSERAQGHKIYVNCYRPGWVKTAVTGYVGNNTADEGADTAVWLALLPDQPVSGKFFAERREIKF